LQLLILLSIAWAPLPPILQTQAPPGSATPDPDGGEDPLPTADFPESTPTPAPSGISRIIHQLLFPAETIAEALTNVFADAAENEAENLIQQAGDWSLLLGQIVQAPSRGYYQAVARSSLPVAAALAPALFLLRLALYHWRRLVGDDDAALKVIGDWVTAGFLAVAAGPFLDLLTELGWWIAGVTLGETAQLALTFVQSTTVFSVMDAVAQVSLFSGILVLMMTVGGILAMAGMLSAFGAASAALYVMAVVAAPIAVAGVLRQMRWLRSLWIKAVAVLALLPVVAGGIFKAGVMMAAFFAGEGLLSLLIRLLWLWGATGFLIALAGILGRVTLSASVGALGQLGRSVKAIVSTAVMAGSLAGAGSGAAGLVSGATDTPLAGAAFSGRGSGLGSGEAILSHYDQAAELTQRAGTFGALGLQTPAQYARTQARGHELTARRLELGQRLARFSGYLPESMQNGDQISNAPDFGFSPTVNQRIATTFSRAVTGFDEGFSGLSHHIERAGFDPNIVAERYPEDTGRMVSAYLEHRDQIDQADHPLLEAARLSGADHFRTDIFGRSAALDETSETP